MSRSVVILIALFSMISCSAESKLETPDVQVFSDKALPSEQKSDSVEPPETGEPAMHAVQNSRLQAVMHQINALVYDQLSSEINLSNERQIKTKEIARIANELSGVKNQ